MKKLVIASLTAIALSTSAASFASVSQDDAAYLFGTQEAVEMQIITNTEMATTEGQLFGLTIEGLQGALGDVVEYIKPYAKTWALALKDKAVAAIKARFDSYLAGTGSVTVDAGAR